MSVAISGVTPGSPAEALGIRAGDRLLRIDGHAIDDVLDYRFYMVQDALTLTWEREDGTVLSGRIEKDEYEEPGLEFETYLMDRQRVCRNKCVFCFIDQMPAGMRESLYFKDDDSRMSFLFGNYVTLTNLEDRDIERILTMRISPINVSVHTTNPALRVHMMKNPRSGDVLRYLPRLTEGGIAVNAQLVLCPGINDREELVRSLGDLCSLAPAVQSVAVVPVGLTRHRAGLPELRGYTPGEARDMIEAVDRFGSAMLQAHGTRICYPADELFLKAGMPVPAADYYEDFPQLENGVGLLALLEEEFMAALAAAARRPAGRRATVATGVAAAGLLRSLSAAAAARFPGLDVQVQPIENAFFGEQVTVAGLVTGGDLLAQLHGRELGDELLIPAVMLRREGDLFLDSIRLEDVATKLGVPVRPVKNDGEELLAAMLGASPEHD